MDYDLYKNEPVNWHFHPMYQHKGFSMAEAIFNKSDDPIREIIQNSMDAVLDTDYPVSIEIELLSWQFKDIPGHEVIRRAMRAIIDQNNDDKLAKWRETLSDYLKKDHINVLRISDYNTTGLSGWDHQKGTTAFSLLQAEGTSHGDRARGGSFGFGKYAPFNMSDLRMIFYNSLNTDGEFIFAGKSIFPSFSDLQAKNNPDKDGLGNYGHIHNLKNHNYPSSSAIRDPDQIPKPWSTQRQGSGLDIYIIGYPLKQSGGQSWHHKILHSSIFSFWASIHFNKLNIKLKDDARGMNLSIKKDTLKGFMDREAKQFPSEKRLGRVCHYYSAVNQDEKDDCFHYFEENLDQLGLVKLWIKTGDSFSWRKVARMRQPKMLIDEKSYSGNCAYAGVLICDDDEGNKRLRELENPQHDRWQGQNLQDKKVLERLGKFVEDKLQAIKPPTTSEGFYVLAGILSPGKSSDPGFGLEEHQVNPIGLRIVNINPQTLKLIVRSQKPIAKIDLELKATTDNHRLLPIPVDSVYDIDYNQTIYPNPDRPSQRVILSQISLHPKKPRFFEVKFPNRPRYHLVLQEIGHDQ